MIAASYQHFVSYVDNVIDYVAEYGSALFNRLQQSILLQRVTLSTLTIVACFCTLFIVWGGIELYNGGTIGDPIDEISVENNSNQHDYKMTSLGNNRYRIDVEQLKTPLKLRLSSSSQGARNKSLVLRLGDDYLYNKPTITNLRVNVGDASYHIDSLKRHYIPVDSQNDIYISVEDERAIQSTSKNLILSEVSIFEKPNWDNFFLFKAIDKNLPLFISLVLICLFIGRAKTPKWFSIFIIISLFCFAQLNELLINFNPEQYQDLRIYYTNGTLREFPGSNLNYGLHMAINLLQGNGLTIDGLPLWHRMPGYGLLLALSSNRTDFLLSALNGALLQLFLTSCAVGFFYHCCQKITAHWVALLLIFFIISMGFVFNYHQIESIMPAVVLINLSAACLFIHKYYSEDDVPLFYHLFLHGSFALWFLMRPDVLPGWAIVSVLLYARKLKTLKYLLIPGLFVLVIGALWGGYKYQFTHEFSPTTTSFGASLMVGLWEIPNAFQWEISDFSYHNWIATLTNEPSISKTANDLATYEVLKFWFTYPFYMVSLVWHKFIDYMSLLSIYNPIYQYALFFIMLLVMSFSIAYKRIQTLLLGWPILFNVPLFFLIFSSAGRFYIATSFALLTTSFILLFDLRFIKKIIAHPKTCITILALFGVIHLWGRHLDNTMMDAANFRYATPFLSPDNSSLSVFKQTSPQAKIAHPSQINLADFNKAHKKSHVSLIEDSTLLIKTSPQRFYYAASIDLPNYLKDNKPVYLKIDASVISGEVLIGVLSKDKSYFLSNSKPLSNYTFQKTRDHQVLLVLNNVDDAGSLVIQNGTQNGSSTVKINQIEYGNKLRKEKSHDQ